MIRCRLCGVNGSEAKGVVLQRVNEKGVEGIWECRPICGAQMSGADALEAAIEGVFDEPQIGHRADKARVAADEIDACLARVLSAPEYLKAPGISQIAAIISKHFPPTEAAIPAGDSPDGFYRRGRYEHETAQLKAELRHAEQRRIDLLDDYGARLATAERRQSTARANAIDEAIAVLSERRKAYRESTFTPLAEGETAKVHKQWPGLVDRMSADVCRWILDDMASDLEALKQKDDGDRSNR